MVFLLDRLFLSPFCRLIIPDIGPHLPDQSFAVVPVDPDSTPSKQGSDHTDPIHHLVIGGFYVYTAAAKLCDEGSR